MALSSPCSSMLLLKYLSLLSLLQQILSYQPSLMMNTRRRLISLSMVEPNHSISRQNKFKTFLTAALLPMMPLIPLVPLTSFPSPAVSGFFSSKEQDAVDSVASFQKPVATLLSQLRPIEQPNAIGVYQTQQTLRGSKEDNDVVATYLGVYIRPLQEKLAQAVQVVAVDSSKQERFRTLPLLMKGHILELEDAIRSKKADAQAREVEEVQETLDEFLKLAATVPSINVQFYQIPKPASDAQLFGPLGCEFYGKSRIPGSNACSP